MKARRKGDIKPFEDVYKIAIGRGLNAEYIPINEVEFEQQQAIEIPFGAKDSELQEVTFHIPNGYHAEINGNAVVIKKSELINDTPSQDHWQDVRERAAIAVLPQCLKIIQDVLWRGGSLTEDTIVKQAATNAVDYADALVKKLKGE